MEEEIFEFASRRAEKKSWKNFSRWKIKLRMKIVVMNVILPSLGDFFILFSKAEKVNWDNKRKIYDSIGVLRANGEKYFLSVVVVHFFLRIRAPGGKMIFLIQFMGKILINIVVGFSFLLWRTNC